MSTHPLAQKCFDVVNDLQGKPNVFGSPAVIDKNGATTSCSSLGTLMLAKYEVPLVLWTALFGRSWPRAREYFNSFDRLMLGDDDATALKGVGSGTLAAIGYDEDRETMSGHFFICLDTPIATGHRYGDLTEYSVRVFDSCRSSHGEDDTRWTPTGAKGGIGIGKMALLVDDLGDVKGYRWSLSVASEVMHNGRGQSLAFANIPADWSLRHG